MGQFSVVEPERGPRPEELAGGGGRLVARDDVDGHMGVALRRLVRGLGLERRREDVEFPVRVADRDRPLEEARGHVEQVEERLVEVRVDRVREEDRLRFRVELREDLEDSGLHRPEPTGPGVSTFAPAARRSFQERRGSRAACTSSIRPTASQRGAARRFSGVSETARSNAAT